MMAWKYVLLAVGVFIAAMAYWLYTPLPDGLSSACAQQIQIGLASGKVITAVVCILLIFKSVCEKCGCREPKHFNSSSLLYVTLIVI